jgi:hypothetical protein
MQQQGTIFSYIILQYDFFSAVESEPQGVASFWWSRSRNVNPAPTAPSPSLISNIGGFI